MQFSFKGRGNSRRKFCSAKCRTRSTNIRYREAQRKWQLARLDREARLPGESKIQCLICQKWYTQLGSHVVIRHGYKTAREYREEYGLDVKKGLTKGSYRALLSKQVYEKGTIENLKSGARFRFKPEDSRAGRYNRSQESLKRLTANMHRYHSSKKKFGIKSIAKFFKTIIK